MRLLQRIRRLETKARAGASDYSHISDEELEARVVWLAKELQASGPLDPEIETFLRANELWFDNDRR